MATPVNHKCVSAQTAFERDQFDIRGGWSISIANILEAKLKKYDRAFVILKITVKNEWKKEKQSF
jgi:hypothetical protein